MFCMLCIFVFVEYKLNKKIKESFKKNFKELNVLKCDQKKSGKFGIFYIKQRYG